MRERQALYRAEARPGLFSVLTAVWDGSPIEPLKRLADSLLAQNFPCEWIVLDNGCQGAKLVTYLRELSGWNWVRLLRAETNVGILRGLQLCLENATAKYVLPVDADDLLYPDALRIVAVSIEAASFPALLYSDEDKVIGRRVYQPYVKPDWDPVLLLNSAYTAHLGVMDREKALELGVYSDAQTEGSPDWDAFVRFLAAGERGVHIPEVVYSWRVHGKSTADDAAHKSYVHASQRAVLERYLDASAHRDQFEVAYNELFGGGAHFRLRRRQEGAAPLRLVRLSDGRASARSMAEAAEADVLVALVGEKIAIEDDGWTWEAQGLFELHRDAVMVGGLIRKGDGSVETAGAYFGFDGVLGSPDKGRAAADPGYFGGVWKQRSVSAVSSQFCVLRAEFLRELLRTIPEQASIAFLGAWAGAHAMRTQRRVIYTPFLRAFSEEGDWDELVCAAERDLFEHLNSDLIPDRRFYSPHFSLQKPYALEP